MTQLTQGSDMELKLAEFGFELLTLHDKYPAYETATEEYRAKYEAEESHLISLYAKAIEAHEQRSIDRAVSEARIDELARLLDVRNPDVASFRKHGIKVKPIKRRLLELHTELEQQLSPTTKKGNK